jgi:hypothetical protein
MIDEWNFKKDEYYWTIDGIAKFKRSSKGSHYFVNIYGKTFIHPKWHDKPYKANKADVIKYLFEHQDICLGHLDIQNDRLRYITGLIKEMK